MAVLLRSIELTGILSFRRATLELRPLNILIGPNASGKSNLISALGLLRAAPGDLLGAIMWGGGIRPWLCQLPGAGRVARLCAQLEVADEAMEYSLDLGARASTPYISAERLKHLPSGDLIFNRQGNRVERLKPSGEVGEAQVVESASFLASFRDPSDETPITMTGEQIGNVRLFRGFNTTPNSPVRAGISVGVPKDFLLETGDNLALVLQSLIFRGAEAPINEFLQRLWDRAETIRVNIEGQIAQTYVKERDIPYPISAVRLSDGTLKFLCLLAVLLHPDPPPLICIEEPELGLHPDAIAIVADALRHASQHTQLIVTTHSEALVSAFSDDPETIVVCERDEQGGSQFRRLNSADLDEWLERYSLGELWRKGEIGGNRSTRNG